MSVFEQELLALGERIGNVSTGLSEDSIAKCLKETVQYSSEKFQDQSRCVICLVSFQFLVICLNCMNR